MAEIAPDPPEPAASPDESREESIGLAMPETGAAEEELVLAVLRSGSLALGPMLDRFEQALAERLGVDDVVATSSGTAALHLGVRLQGWTSGDEVVTTPLSFVASANCLLYEDVTPVFCDVDPQTLTMDADAAAAAVSSRTAGILPVHIFGYPVDLRGLRAFADSNGLSVLEDACQALGAVDAAGVSVGASGDPSAFGFYPNKQITTGEGGALVPGSADAAARVRSERNQGRAPDMGEMAHDRLGFNYRMSDLNAAVGVGQLDRLDGLLAARERVATAYTEALSGIDGIECLIANRPPERRSWFVYVVQLPEGADRDAVISELAGRGIQTKAYLPCIHLYPHFREQFGFKGGEFPNAERFSARALALPFHTSLSESQVKRIVAALADALGQPFSP
ncbi:MAG: DegT/DnrJ/EryC1/StrS family aminotransferase [Solirubrobacterales bacterium]